MVDLQPKLEMKYLALLIFLSFAMLSASSAQSIDVNAWASHIADSLQKINIDTIEYYHEYCGECVVETPPPRDTDRHRNCEIKGSWEERANVILYKQNGQFYSLTFDCSYPPIKKPLYKVQSLDYFISIIPILNKRDKALLERQKKHLFPEPTAIDGGYQQATLYFHGKKKSVYLHDDDMLKVKPFWLKYEQKLARLIALDLK